MVAHSKIVCAFLFIFAYGHYSRVMRSIFDLLPKWAITLITGFYLLGMAAIVHGVIRGNEVTPMTIIAFGLSIYTLRKILRTVTGR